MKWKIEKQHEGMLVRDYLRYVRAFSRTILVAVKTEGGIFLNGEPIRVRAMLSEGDELHIVFPKEERGVHLEPSYKPIEILYEDEAVLVINKPPYLATIPSVHHLEDTLANRIIAYYEEKGIPYTTHIVTRLDANSSGIVLVAKHRLAHSILSTQQEAKEVQRTYVALVEGKLNQKKGSIIAPIGRKDTSIIERIVREDGQRAVTHYEVMEEQPEYTLVQLKLETGRTHQIRVHLSSIGHPLLGDDLYGGNHKVIERQALHCSSITFSHPFTRENMEVQVEIAEDMRKYTKGLFS
ncbi:RluA family pseudouridine synthase [Pontibacillus salicampi]|uniref:Pseudouridine synthase n=1 Tax=Pontibacillus salicampi TaxID=1449801 RepID=A0ABV6LQR8_9BACI